MKRLVLFLLLTAAGLAILALLGGGFLGSGIGREHPEVKQGPPLDPNAPKFDLPRLKPSAPPAKVSRSERFETRGQEWREWLEPVSGERFVYPVFVPWTFHAGEVRPVEDPFTGDQGALCKDVRVRFFRDPSTRAEAEALRADPNARSLLVQWEITGDEGRADFVPREASGTEKHDPKRKPAQIVHLTKAVRLVNLSQGMTLECSDLTVDLKTGTAVGRGEIVADFPTYVIHGRGLKIDRREERVEIEEASRVDVKTVATTPGALPPIDIGAGEFQPKRLSSPGGTIVTRLRGPRGEWGLVVRFSQRVHMDEEGGGTLDADTAELVAVRATSSPPATPSPSDHPTDAPPEAYRLRSFTAEGHVDVRHPGGSGGGSFLATLSAARLEYQAASDGPGLTLVDGPGSATYHGEFKTTDAPAAPGTIRVGFQKAMRFGPAGQDRPEAPLRLFLEERATISHEPDDGSEADRLEADRVDVFLRQGTPAPRIAGDAKPPTKPGLVAVGFLAEGDARLFGPHLAGTAERFRGEGLDQPGSRLIAEAAEGREAYLRAANPTSPASPTSTKRASADAVASGAPGAPPRATATPGAKTSWMPDSIDATGDVRASLRNASAGASTKPVIGEADRFHYRPEDGSRLDGGLNGNAAVWMSVASGREDLVTAPTIHYSTEGTLSTEGKTPTHAVFWVGDGDEGAEPAEPSPKSKDADVVEMRGGKRIEIAEGPSPGVDYVLRIVGGGSLALHAADEIANRLSLSATSIEVAISERAPRAGDAFVAAAPPAGRATSRRSSPSSPSPLSSKTSTPREKTAKAAAAPVRWTCDCMGLSITVDAAGGAPNTLGSLRTFVAVGDVTVASDVDRFEGERFEVDGTTRNGRLLGGPRRRATIHLGVGDKAQRVASAAITFHLAEGGGIERARVAGRFVAVLRPAADKDHPNLDHVDMVGDGDLVVTADGAVTDGHVIVRGTPAAGATSAKPWSLSTPHLEVRASHMLAGGAVTLDGLTAWGEGTRIDMGSTAESNVAAIGDRLVYDAATGIATITGSPRAILIQQGKTAYWKTVRLDVKTGLPDFEGGRIVIGGGR